jgi:hypothetical protein
MGEPPRSWFERACGGAAFLVPFGVALAHVGSSSAWRDDLPLLRGLAWVGNDRTGGLSAILVQTSFLVPFGSVYFRAGLAAALVLAASGFVLFLLTRRVLDEGADTPRLSAALAAIAALTATLGSTGQREGTVAGGGAAALLSTLCILARRPERAFREPRGALAVGLLFGALAAESGVVALALAAGVGVALLVARAPVRRRQVLYSLAGAGASSLFVLAPLYVRPVAASPFLDLGRSLAAMGPAPLEAPGRSLGALGALRDEVGRAALAIAVAGGVVGLARARLRAATVPLVLVTSLDLALSFREGSILSGDEFAPLHLVALAFLCVGIAIAVQALCVTLLDMRLVMARQTTILLVMGDLALAAASAEEASFSADRSVSRGAQVFTDEAVERVVPGAAIFVRSRATAQRLWAARATDGMRPDLLVVPVPLLGDGRIALGLLRREPALQQALRDVSLEGRPGEEALTIVADARPAMVELDSRWDRRIVSHLVADHFWMRFAPEPLGPSDRKAAFADLRSRFIRVLDAATVDDRVDPSTGAVLRARLTDAAAQAAILGDRDEAIAVLEQLGKVSSGDPFVVELTRRLAATKSGPIDPKGLLR